LRDEISFNQNQSWWLFGEEKCSGKKELGKRIKLIKERMQRLSDLRFPSVAFYDIN